MCSSTTAALVASATSAIARSVRDTCGVTATQLQTQALMGTTIYMSPESMRGELSCKVDAFAFGLVIIEALTGLPVLHPAAGRRNLLTMFEEDMDTAEEFLKHLDTRLEEVLDAFCCPILLDVMSDPVVLIETGHTFERSAIEDHLKRCNRGPLCGVQLKSRALMPNFALRQAIETYLSESGQAPAPSAPERRA